MKRTFTTGAVLSVTTGRLLCEFSAMHELIEFLVGSPIFTHQLAHGPFNDELKEAVFAQHPHLRTVDPSGVTTANWRKFLEQQVATLGESLELSPILETKTARESFVEPLARFRSK